jgi:hypothetical protein
MNTPTRPDCPHWRTMKPGEVVTTTVGPASFTCPQCERDKTMVELKTMLHELSDAVLAYPNVDGELLKLAHRARRMVQP